MLAKRALVVIILLPIGLAAILYGGIAYILLVSIILGLAAWEFTQLFHSGGLKPSGVLVVSGTVLLAVGRAWNGFESAPWIISLLILTSMTYHLLDYERGRDQAATDFSITIAGLLYFGWLGAYLVSLRDLPDGKWWLLVALPSVWLADSGAYFIGSRLGRHKFSPRLSPKKTWEGFFGGVLFGILGGVLLTYLWGIWMGSSTAITPVKGAILGLVLALLTPLGDLGESMIKRQVGAKDSGKLLPGHGGMFDRIDSWLWAGAIGYYLIVVFMLTS